jgi:thiamine transport system permease protein
MPALQRLNHVLQFWLVALLIFGFLVVLVVYPFVALLTRGIDVLVLFSPYTLERLGITLLQASLSSALIFALALVCGTLLGRYQFYGKTWLEAWLGVPFVVPVLVAGLGFLALFGNRGLVKLEGTLWLVLAANLFYNLGTAVRLCMNAPFNPELEQVARLEGASSWQVWRFVSLPTALPAALLGAGLAFLYCFASFAVPLLLGGSAFATLEVEMYQAVQRLELQTASALALLQAGLMLLVGFAITTLERQTAHAAEWSAQKPLAKGSTKIWLGVVVALLLISTALPLLAVLWRSVSSPDGFTLQHFAKVFANPNDVFSALWNNLRFAGMALLVAIPLGMLCANVIWRGWRWLDTVSLLPLAVSSTVLGVGLIVAYPQLAAQLPLLIGVYALSAFPLIARAMLQGLRQLEPNLLEAASLDGAGVLERWRFVILPLTQASLRGGVGLGFAVVVGEFAATLMLSRPEWTTLSTLIYQRLSRPNQLGEACALAVILLGLTMLGLWGISRQGAKAEG